VTEYGLAVDGVGYATSGGFVDDIAGQLDEIKGQIVSGAITVPTVPGERTVINAVGSAENPIQVLYVPSTSAEEIVAGGELLAAQLNAATGLTYEVSVPTSYAATVEAMCAAPENTIGFIPAQAYVLANQLCGVEAALKSIRFGYDVYWAQFLVPRDSDIQTFEELAGMTWGYPDAGSTSGYLFPLGMFTSAGIEPGETLETGGHPASVRAVYNGEVDFSTSFYSPPIDADRNVLWDGTAENADIPADLVDSCAINADGEIQCGDYIVRDARRNLREELPDVVQKVRILTLSPPIPNDLMTFGPDFPADVAAQITDAMLAYADSDPDGFATAFAPYSWTGVALAVDAELDSVRLLLEAIGYDLEDLG
jgi:phosphonate transport system substrate-binding protein